MVSKLNISIANELDNCNLSFICYAGSHVLEGMDGRFYLLRGTNMNESFHKRLNHIWPEKLAERLASNLLKAFLYNWNGRRLIETVTVPGSSDSESFVTAGGALGNDDFTGSDIAPADDMATAPRPRIGFYGSSSSTSEFPIIAPELAKRNTSLSIRRLCNIDATISLEVDNEGITPMLSNTRGYTSTKTSRKLSTGTAKYFAVTKDGRGSHKTPLTKKRSHAEIAVDPNSELQGFSTHIGSHKSFIQEELQTIMDIVHGTDCPKRVSHGNQIDWIGVTQLFLSRHDFPGLESKKVKTAYNNHKDRLIRFSSEQLIRNY